MDKQSFINSTDKYLYGMQKLARYDLTTTRDLFLLSIIGTLQDWACWYDLSDCEYKHLEELSQCIIINNPDLELYNPTSYNTYTNVNTPQTDYSWIVNDINPIEIETGYILRENSDYLNFEEHNRVIQETYGG